MPLCSLRCRLSPICVLLLSALVRAQVWYDNRASDLTKEGMLQGIERAAAFILFLSADVLNRSYCQMEIRHALALKKPVVLLHGERESMRCVPAPVRTVPFVRDRRLPPHPFVPFFPLMSCAVVSCRIVAIL